MTECAEGPAPGVVAGGAPSAATSRNYDSASPMPWNRSLSGGANEYAPAQVAPPTHHRPGLATVAGNETWAPVQSGWFHRKSSGVPDAVDSFHYNDETGAKAMMEPLGGGSRHGGLFAAAGDRMKIGLVSGGNELPRLERRGQIVVMGVPGQYFDIQIKNTTKHRVEAIVSVDGLDVLDGQAASIRKPGYVLEVGQEYTIQGFRMNRDRVKQFVFGAVSDSEAAKKGQARNVGVVGLAVYEEDEVAAKAEQFAEAFKRTGASAFPRN
jgi:hypothetical protein